MSAPLDRSKYIGGSDAAGILGISPYKTQLDVYLDKVEPRVEIVPEGRRRVLERGHRMEPYIVMMLAEQEQLTVVARNMRHVDSEHPFLAAEIDAEYVEPKTHKRRNIEIKTVTPWKSREWGEQDTDAIPPYYTAQAMHGLMVTGRDVTLMGVLIGGDDFRVYRVERDEETIAGLRRHELDFWKRVVERRPPEPTTSADVQRLFDVDAGKTVEASGDVLQALLDLRECRAQIKALEKAAEPLEEQIKLHMRDAAALTIDGRPAVTWRAHDTRRLDYKAFADAHPDLAEAFYRTTTTRTFRIK